MKRARASSGDDGDYRAAPRKSRRWPYAIVALLAVLVAGAIVVRAFVRPEKLTAKLVAEVGTRLGATLELGGNARFGVWPSLHVDLPQAALRGASATTPFLATEAIDVVVPWRSLWADTLVIERIELHAPRLDLDALDSWLASRPPGGDMASFSVHLVASDASLVRGTTTIASGIALDLESAGDLAAWLALSGTDATNPLIPPLAGSIEAAQVRVGDTQLKDVRIDIDADGSTAPAAQPAQP